MLTSLLKFTLLLLPLTLASPLSIRSPVKEDTPDHSIRVGSVIKYCESHGVPLPWESVTHDGMTVKKLNLSPGQYEYYADLAKASGNMTDGDFLPSDSEGLDKRANLVNTVMCYGSGSWARGVTIAGVSGLACKGFSYGVLGGDQIVQIRLGTDGEQLVNGAGDPMTLVFAYRALMSSSLSRLAMETACGMAISAVIETQCTGDHQDTRGGKVKVREEGSSEPFGEFKVDPQTDNCNC